jgi:hypothetical protein
VFVELDTDKSGTLDSEELYSGVLLLHLELAKYLGPAACKPPSRELVANMFRFFDADKSNNLDAGEFSNLMIILLSNVMGRVLFQFSMTIALVPLAAPSIIEYAVLFWAMFCSYISELDPFNLVTKLHSAWAEQGAPHFDTYILPITTHKFYELAMSLVPATIYVTLVSCVLVAVIVPGVLETIDELSIWMSEFFHGKRKKE